MDRDQTNGTGPPDPRRRLPRTDAVLADPRLVAAAERLGRRVVKSAVVQAQDRARRNDIAAADVADTAVRTPPATAAALRPVINATGVLLHTNRGRAALSEAARQAILAASGHTDVEFDLVTGERAARGRSAVAALLGQVPAAQAAHVVNNGAAALVLAATALAQDREIIVSRGELVEIGDGFRLPDLLVSTGARLREVGTTNRTSVADYTTAIAERTGFILKIHPSNFRITGFTGGVGVAELAALGPLVVADLGSGLLRREPLLPDEPDADTWLRAGAALVTASGDKLLGGPQCGLLLGRADVVRPLARHPLARALRVDKLTLAALEATVNNPETPTRSGLHGESCALRARAERLAAGLAADGIPARAVDSRAVVGAGGAPGVTLDSAALALPEVFAARLRQGPTPVVGRVVEGRCLLDLRAVAPHEDGSIAAAVRAAAVQDAVDADRACT
ncbi:L-seryl-tRNA(Sec) selenium transferase [Streptantibioticus rubrisoli]|uniref:L-seryl-tRNA(Sec) selenium transferase n=1 Tax=Streptantibioticus rubrisoli TaxID=1387313 RepID=A0ABT1PBD9_9ACTN|nr:L-seryl-tRNA(Sec) selenium transferase [Streptantibioticus rubrisoli]MCQ4042682.1 L-seryl-tRNA(Sec) selenium transferase [Streptantibioticus rubrisoli]